MQFLTQWKHLDLSKLGDLLGCRGWAEDLWQKVAADGFGQMRWYGVDRETTRHSDGFDGGDEVGKMELYWLVVWNIFYFPYIGNNHPN